MRDNLSSNMYSAQIQLKPRICFVAHLLFDKICCADSPPDGTFTIDAWIRGH